MDVQEQHRVLVERLGLLAPPVALAFRDEAPASVHRSRVEAAERG
jgi:hypothetical protein